jgi:hypothetical protein
MLVRSTLAALFAVVLLAAPPEARTRSLAFSVRSAGEFEAAVSALRDSGGTIVLQPGGYSDLVIPPRSARPLRIVGGPGVWVQGVLFDHTQHVSLGRLTIFPSHHDALVEVRTSAWIDLHDLVVTARGTPFSASVLLPDARNVTVRRSTFTHCGDREIDFANCVLLYRWSHRITVEDNWFHDCYGCDFVHGRFGSDLTIRHNRFERALPCGMGRYRCGHQDLVQLFLGRRLLVEDNRFGVYRNGAAQLYLTNAIDHATIVNNVFVGTDRRVRGYHARVAVIVGSSGSRRLPHDVKIANNTILTGTRRRDGYEGSIRISSRYGGVPRRLRPLLANNVIGLLRERWPVCDAVRASVANVVLRGQACTSSDVVGPADTDDRGRPTRESALLIDQASRRWAPTRDITGRRRGAAPDIGAYEFRG